jgi:aminopeptidase
MAYIDNVDIQYKILASSNTRELNEIDPARLAISQAAARPYVDTFMRRYGDNTFHWNVCAWPTEADAQEAGMGLLAYTEFVYNACGLNQPDPVAYWKTFSTQQARLVEWLNGKHQAEVCGPGIDLQLDFTGRTWVSCDGHVNFPDGEIYTGPVENSVNGHVEFNYPSVLHGHSVEGVRLIFKDGVVIEAHADKGEDFLLNQLALDEGSKRLGEFAIGTNAQIQRHTGNTLFDEKIGGTIHMALGLGFPNTGSLNQSSIHWDMVHNMKNGGEIRIDGDLFYQNGRFMI